MTAINQNFSIFAGNTKSITVTVDDAASLTGATIEFNIKKNENSNAILTKTNVSVSGNTITITLNPTDTENFSGSYYHECVLTDQYGNVSTLSVGTITFNKGGGGLTAQQVFEIAMNIMDEETQDGTYNGYPEEYKRKSWSILTLLQSELSPGVPSVVIDETSILYIDDRTCLSVLPYGLAAHLLLTEDPVRASYFNNRYDELKRKRPSKITKITDVYSVNTATEGTTSSASASTSDDSFDGNTDTFDGGGF